MGMARSPHRKRRPPKLTGDVLLPMGKKGATSHKAAGGNEPDPQGKIHVVPMKTKRKRREKKVKPA